MRRIVEIFGELFARRIEEHADTVERGPPRRGRRVNVDTMQGEMAEEVAMARKIAAREEEEVKERRERAAFLRAQAMELRAAVPDLTAAFTPPEPAEPSPLYQGLCLECGGAIPYTPPKPCSCSTPKLDPA